MQTNPAGLMFTVDGNSYTFDADLFLGAGFKPHHCHNFTAERRHRRTVRMDKLDRRRSHLSHCRADDEQDLHRDIQHAILPDDDRRNRWHSEPS